MLAVSAIAENETYDQNKDKSPSVNDIGSQIKTLQDEVRRLREEADVRNKLEATVDEKTDQEKEILSAAGQDYALAREGTLEITYGFIYAYNATDILESISSPEVDHSSNHNLTNNLNFKYALIDNLSLNATIPFVYKTDQRSTSNEKNATDIGDVSFGGIWQPKKSDGKNPTIMYNGSIVLPTGASPFKIDADNALATGSGFYSVSAGLSISKSLDPVFVFGSGSIYYPMDVSNLSQRRTRGANESDVLKKVSPGKTIGISAGMAYALSYTVSLNTSVSYTYATKYKYYWENSSPNSSGDSTSAVLNIGTGWRISPQKTLSTSLGIGLTNSASDFTLSFSIPFDFKL
jgi:hypothetical protein